MDFRFNLLDDPWIPCLRKGHSSPDVLSLRDVLTQAASLMRVVDARPTTMIALHRLILALLHRALDGPHTRADWQTVWRQRTWAGATLDGYLLRWHDRFNLFDPHYPFYQTPGLDIGRAVAVSTLAHDRASNVNSPMLFDHQLAGAGVTPAEAARWIIGQQQFATPGLISDDQSPLGKVSASGSPLMGSLVCLAQGQTLFETLMLNWVQYDPQHEVPWSFAGDDQPVWERDPIQTPQTRQPAGYADWLMWPSRRILLVPEHNEQGQTVVRGAVLMDGARTPPDFPLWKRETMVAFRKNPRSASDTTATPWLATRLDEERAIWRESHALLSGFTKGFSETNKPPKVLEVLANMEPHDLADYRLVPLAVAGVINHQKNVVNWSQDTLIVSRHLLTSDVTVDAVRQALELAERAGKLLTPTEISLGAKGKPCPTPMKVLTSEFIKGLGEREPQSKDAVSVADHMGIRRAYWAALDLPFHAFLRELPDAVSRNADDDEIVGDALRRRWLSSVMKAFDDAFDLALRAIGESPRALRARALAEASRRLCRSWATKPYMATLEGDTDEA